MHDLKRPYILGHGLQEHLRRPHPREQLQPEAAATEAKEKKAHKPRDPGTQHHFAFFSESTQPQPQPILKPPSSSPVDPALHRPLRRAPEPDPRPVHLRIGTNPSENPAKAQMQATTGGEPARVGVRASTLSATKSTTDSAFSGAVRPLVVMPRQRSLSVGGGRAPPPSPPPPPAATAAACAGRAKHQARPFTGKTTTRACIARRGGRRRRGGDWAKRRRRSALTRRSEPGRREEAVVGSGSQ